MTPGGRLLIRPRPPLVFIHIPKTAGTNVRDFLDSQYPIASICRAGGWKDVKDVESLKDFALVRGHFNFSVTYCLPPAFRSFVILRNPLNRTLSTLRHMQRDVQTRILCSTIVPKALIDYVRGAEARQCKLWNCGSRCI